MSVKIDQQQRRIVSTVGFGGRLFTTLFGGIWMAVGWGIMYSLLTGGDVTVNDRPGTPADAWMPAIFGVIGTVIACFRYRKLIDLNAGTVLTRWGIVFYLFGKPKSVPPLAAVTITHERRKNKNSHYSVYPVALTPEQSGEDALTIDSPREKKKARSLAEQLAKLIDKPVHDESAGERIVREVANLDRSVLDVEEVAAREPDLPENMQATTDLYGNISLRVPGLSLLGSLGCGVVMIVPLLAFWFFVWRDQGMLESGTVGTLFYYAPLLMAGVPMLIGLLKRVLSGSGVIKIIDGGIRIGRKHIDRDALEELVYVRRGLVARSDDHDLRLGRGYDEDAANQLRAYLLYHLKRS